MYSVSVTITHYLLMLARETMSIFTHSSLLVIDFAGTVEPGKGMSYHPHNDT